MARVCVLASALALLAHLGCNAVFGITDVELEPAVDGSPGSDGGDASEAATDADRPDGEPVDGGADAPLGDGSTPPTVFLSGLVIGTRLATDGTNLYVNDAHFAPSGRILSCPLAGCPATGPVVLADHLNLPSDVAVASGTLYWTTRGTNGSPTGTVSKCTIGSCVPSIVNLTQINPIRVAARGTRVYWVSGDNTDGGVLACDPTDCASPQVLSTNLAYPTSLTTDGTEAIFGVGSASNISSCPIGGGATNVLASNQIAVDSLVVSGSSLFWTSTILGSGKVRTCALPGCSPVETLYQVPFDPMSEQYSQIYPPAVVVDDGRIYFTISAWTQNTTGGAIATCPLDGGCGLSQSEPNYLAQGLEMPDQLLKVGKRLFWSTTTGKVMTMTLP